MKSLLLALLCLLLASWLARAADTPSAPNPAGLKGSLWGALIAELMRPSLHRYWHLGRDHQQSEAPRRLGRRAASPAQPGSSLLGPAMLLPNTPVPPSAALKRHSQALADTVLHQARQFGSADWVLWDLLLDAGKLGFAKDPQGTWERLLQQSQMLLQDQRNAPTLASELCRATVLSHLLEMAHAAKRPDWPQWRDHLQRSLGRCSRLLHEAEQRGDLESLSSARMHELLTQLHLLEQLSSSYPKA